MRKLYFSAVNISKKSVESFKLFSKDSITASGDASPSNSINWDIYAQSLTVDIFANISLTIALTLP